MEYSMLYDLLSTKLYKYRKELENNNDDNFVKNAKQSKLNIKEKLNEETRKLFDQFVFDHDLNEDFINDSLSVKILNYGVLIGMQLQKAFDEENK